MMSLATCLEIPLSYLFAYIFAGEEPNYLSLIGAALVFAVVVAMAIKVRRKYTALYSIYPGMYHTRYWLVAKWRPPSSLGKSWANHPHRAFIYP